MTAAQIIDRFRHHVDDVSVTTDRNDWIVRVKFYRTSEKTEFKAGNLKTATLLALREVERQTGLQL